MNRVRETPSRNMLPEVVHLGDGRYNELRCIWNGSFDRYPAELLLCRNTGDVTSAIRYAHSQRLPLAVRAGGHSPAGFSTLDEGIVIDLRGLQMLTVDPERRVAHVGAGNLWHQFDAATQHYGLATTGGTISTVGVVGFTLGGGVGLLLRKYGLGCDNLLAAEVVMADGTVVRAAPDSDTDLYWALRGGAGNFGIVTELTFQLHPLHEVTAGMLLYPLDDAVEVLHELRERISDAPDDLTWYAAFITAPLQGSPFPGELRGRPVVLLNLAYFGSTDEAERHLRPLRRIGHPRLDTVAPIPYTVLQQLADVTAPYGMQWDMRAEWLRSIDDSMITTIVDAMENTTSPLNQVILQWAGGALAHTPSQATPFSFRQATHFIEIISGAFPHHPHAAQVHEWGRDLWNAVTRWSAGGGCLNHLGIGEGPERVRAAFSDAAWSRLVALKRCYDPENVFRANANIPPE